MKINEHFTTADELAKKYLKPEVIKAIKDVDIKINNLVIIIHFKKRGKEFSILVQADQIIIATFFLVSLVTSALTTITIIVLHK